MEEKSVVNFGVYTYDSKAAVEVLNAWRPGIPLQELRKVAEHNLNYSSPDTRKRYAGAILSALVPGNKEKVSIENLLARFIQKVPNNKAGLEAIFYHILLSNYTLFKICQILRENFEGRDVDRGEIREFLTSQTGSAKGARKTTKKAFSILREYGLITKTKPEKIVIRHPEPESLAYILYHYYISRSSIAPSIESIENNSYLFASFYSIGAIKALLKTNNHLWWEREQRPPLDRIIFKYRSIEEFLNSIPNL